MSRKRGTFFLGALLLLGLLFFSISLVKAWTNEIVCLDLYIGLPENEGGLPWGYENGEGTMTYQTFNQSVTCNITKLQFEISSGADSAYVWATLSWTANGTVIATSNTAYVAWGQQNLSFPTAPTLSADSAYGVYTITPKTNYSGGYTPWSFTAYGSDSNPYSGGESGWGAGLDAKIRLYGVLPTAPEQPVPAFSAFTMTDDDGGVSGFQVNPAEASSRLIVVNASFSHAEGWNNLINFTFNITKDGTPFAFFYNSTPIQMNESVATATGAFNIGYNETPQTYDVLINVTDSNNATGTYSTSFEYTSLVAFTIPTGDINYGVVSVGQNSSIQNMTFNNTGNIQVVPKLSGTNLSSALVTIPVNSVWYGAQASQLYPLSGISTAYVQNLTVFNGTTGSGLLNLDWKWAVPLGFPAAQYAGTISIST